MTAPKSDRATAKLWWVNRLDAAFAEYQAATSSENKKAGR